MNFLFLSRPAHTRSRLIEEALKKCGVASVSPGYRLDIDNDIPIGYGWNWKDRFQCCRNWVYLDLGYWSRDTTYRCAVNDRHPDAYLNRLATGVPHGGKVKPWRSRGSEILILGMSEKAALDNGMSANSWELKVLEKIRSIYPHTPVTYRPKPSWLTAPDLPGCKRSSAVECLSTALNRASAVVTYQSGGALEALAAGIPVYAERGPAKLCSTSLENLISHPNRCDLSRDRALSAASQCQYSYDQIRNGEFLNHLKEVLNCLRLDTNKSTT